MSRRKEGSKEHGLHDEVPELSWSPQRRRFAEQVGLLIRALRSSDVSVQELAVVQISLLGPKVVPYLTAALEEALDEVDLRQSARQSTSNAERGITGICMALGIIGDSESIMDLAAALPRREAVEALAKIGGERALELIMDTIENEPGFAGQPRTRAGRASAPIGTYADPAFVRRVFLLFGEEGRRRLREEVARGSPAGREAATEILRIMDAPGARGLPSEEPLDE